jgi:two-component system, NarL family, nitrate/nitrite response regulator NarL
MVKGRALDKIHTMDKIRLAIVDDHSIFREGLLSVLKTEPDIEIVGEGDSAEDAIRLARELLPDIIFLDISMPGGGLNAAQTIVENYPVVKIIILTGSEGESHVMTALKTGARAYVLKGVAASELVNILHMVQSGEIYVTPTLAANLLTEMTSGYRNEPAESSFEKLTEREHEILALIAAGTSNKEIGLQLHLTEKTVKHYVTNILQKLQVHNRVQAAILALKNEPSKEGRK